MAYHLACQQRTSTSQQVRDQIPLRYLVRSRFGAGSKLVRSWFDSDSVMEFGFEPAPNQLRTSSEAASVMEFGFRSQALYHAYVGVVRFCADVCQFVFIEAIITGFSDQVPILRRNETLFTLLVCVLGFLLGLPLCLEVLIGTVHTLYSFVCLSSVCLSVRLSQVGVLPQRLNANENMKTRKQRCTIADDLQFYDDKVLM